VEAFQYSVGSLAQPGAAVFPIIVGVLLAGVSVFTMVDGYRMRAQPVSNGLTADSRPRVLKFGALIALYTIALVVLGSIASGVLLSAGAMRLLSERKWTYIAVWAVILGVSMHLFFAVALGIPLPRGMVWPQ
jgi:hypothetical protein